MDRAQVPGAPFTPNTRKDWGYAILFGLALSLGLVVSIEHFDDKLKTPEDVTRRLGVPVLGLLPAVRGAVVPVVSNSVPPAFGEAVRSLRTSLVFTSGSVGTRIVALTSTQPGEGKTTATCNLAMVLALGGAKTLIIDADMRRPNLHTLLGLKNSVGLSDLLTGKAPAQQAIQRTEDPNLFALTAGQVPSNPSELLSSPRMRTLLNRLESGAFDRLIIDTPPVLAVTDAVVLSKMGAAVMFVIGAEMTRAGHAQHAIETLHASGNSKVIGALLNRVDFDGNKYYYSRYYGYGYTRYYEASPAAA